MPAGPARTGEASPAGRRQELLDQIAGAWSGKPSR